MSRQQPRRRLDAQAMTAELKTKVLDEARFLKNWIDKPLVTGAIAPSGPALAARMASFVDPSKPGLVIELGPGTGVVTKALLERGLAPERIVAIEYSADFCTLLRNRFPGVHVIHGDAYDLATVADQVTHEPLIGVVSSLPLFTKPLPMRHRLLEASLTRLIPGAPFIQFSYALVPPVPPMEGRWSIDKTNWVVMNLPPARVWTYRRAAAH
jgi:phosphatidylethanolamine/phosphatidyl-N-methylethanolamine N-methyltransferase